MNQDEINSSEAEEEELQRLEKLRLEKSMLRIAALEARNATISSYAVNSDKSRMDLISNR